MNRESLFSNSRKNTLDRQRGILMRTIKRVVGFILVVCTIIMLPITTKAQTTRIQIDDERFEGKTWEEVVRQYMAEHNLNEKNIALGYKNLVTGETHFLNADEYHVGASLYKVPLNMVFTEQISKGEMTFDTKINGVPYSTLIRGSLVVSNNEYSYYLRDELGGVPEYRKKIVDYMVEGECSEEEKIYEHNFFTARQMITCLETLYQGGEERFPRVLMHMKQAQPNQYFEYFKQDYEVAHKYGYLATGNTLQINDCGIVYTDDPIAIVMLTNGIGKYAVPLSNYCILMAEYTRYHRTLRIAEEEREAEREAAREALRVAEQRATESLELMRQDWKEEALTFQGAMNNKRFAVGVYLALATIVLSIVLLVLLRIWTKRRRLPFLPFIVFLLIIDVAIILGIARPECQKALQEPKANPQEVVNTFFDALVDQDYKKAYSCLEQTKSLDLEKQPDNQAETLIYEMMTATYSYCLYNDCLRGRTSAKQQVLLEHLNAEEVRLKAEGKGNPNETLETKVSEVLEKAELYRTVTGIEINLVYTKQGWKIRTDESLRQALEGNF